MKIIIELEKKVTFRLKHVPEAHSGASLVLHEYVMQIGSDVFCMRKNPYTVRTYQFVVSERRTQA